MVIYTRTGDAGQTSVIGGRVGKDDVRVEAYGTIDELNCFVGQARSLMEDDQFDDVREQLLEIQHELFDCGTDLAFIKLGDGGQYMVTSEMAKRLEGWIDELQAENPPLEKFILLGAVHWLRFYMCAVRFAAGRNAGQLHLDEMQTLIRKRLFI